jgi:hypothetical protein
MFVIMVYLKPSKPENMKKVLISGLNEWFFMNILKYIVLPMCLLIHSAVYGYGQDVTKESFQNTIIGYYTRLPFNDSGFTGKFADIVIDLPQKGQFIFSREYSYQPYWVPAGGKRFLVERLVPRLGNGPAERPDKNNICSNVAIVEKSDTSVKVHWRYAPDITKPSFVNFRSAYNTAGNPSEFYAEFTDEYFTIIADGSVIREVRKGCYKLNDWNDPQNQIIQKLILTPTGIKQTDVTQAKLQNLELLPMQGEIVKKPGATGSIINFKFDDGLVKNNQRTIESVSNTLYPVNGVNAYWRKGVSGTCLSFDSYSSAVCLPSSKYPSIGVGLTIEAWVAPQEYPFNWAAIVDHLDGKSGYFLGMDAKGKIGFRVGVRDSIIEVITSPVSLFEWTQITATYNSSKGMSIYINGVSAASKTIMGNITDAGNTDLYIGMTHSFMQYPDGAERLTTKNFKTNMVFSGLIDEVSIFNRDLSPDEIALNYNALKPETNQALKAWSLPDGPINNKARFGAQYSKLQFSPEWDGLWRVGNYADITVTFDNVPWRYVFWRGTRYLPSLVTDYGPKSVWSSDQSPESFWDGQFSSQCYEHMSDMQCRFSHARIISSTDARVVVHWRVSSASIAYEWPMVDENGWGIWTDEYWTIYPDGVSVRHQVVNNNTKATINCEMNQNEILHQPGQTTDNVLMNEAVIGANTKGETQSWYRSKPGSGNHPTEISNQQNQVKNDKNLQFTNLNSKTKQFEIGEIGTWIETFILNDVYWNGWNHYPVQLIPSDGTCIYQYDRVVSSCPSTLHEVRRIIDHKTMEAMVIYGLTYNSPASLTSLNRSWNYAPEVAEVNGCISLGYEKRERAYKFTRHANAMSFKLLATEEKPVKNLAIVVSNWKSNIADDVSLTLNGMSLISGKDYRKGIETDTDGKNVLVLWLEYSSNESTSIRIQ